MCGKTTQQCSKLVTCTVCHSVWCSMSVHLTMNACLRRHCHYLQWSHVIVMLLQVLFLCCVSETGQWQFCLLFFLPELCLFLFLPSPFSVMCTDVAYPSIESFENVMRLSGMTVQALWDTESVFMQLPHIGPNVLKHFYTKKVSSEWPHAYNTYVMYYLLWIRGPVCALCSSKALCRPILYLCPCAVWHVCFRCTYTCLRVCLLLILCVAPCQNDRRFSNNERSWKTVSLH